MEGMNISITAGANQAFVDAAMAVCDEGDNAIILAPYFFSHRMTLQMCNANISICPFDTKTLAPDFEELKRLVSELKPKLVSFYIYLYQFLFYFIYIFTYIVNSNICVVIHANPV